MKSLILFLAVLTVAFTTPTNDPVIVRDRWDNNLVITNWNTEPILWFNALLKTIGKWQD